MRGRDPDPGTIHKQLGCHHGHQKHRSTGSVSSAMRWHFVFYPFSFHDNLAKQLKVKKLTEWIGHVLDLPNQMTDIEQQIAQASGTRKSTAILADPEHVTEPLQIFPFITLFFKTYSAMTRKKYQKLYNRSIYKFGRMLIGFTDPPNFGSIMNNGDYFIYWFQFNTKLEAWFTAMHEMVRFDSKEETYWQQLVDYFKYQDKKTENKEMGALAVVVMGMFEKLDEQYRKFQRALIEQESKSIQSLDETQEIDNTEWINQMENFLQNRDPKEDTTTSEWIKKYASRFVDNVLAPLAIASPFPMPIGAKNNPIQGTKRKLQVLDPKSNKNPVLGETNRSKNIPSSNPAMDKAATIRMHSETIEMANNSITEHYRHIIEDFGNHMLELFRSFNFPPIFSLDNSPSFTAEWQGYIDLAYHSFNDLATQRYHYLQRIGKSTGYASAPPKWRLDEIYNDKGAAALFAEFVGYKKAVPQNTVAPAPNVQRTNATYHYALNNMSLRFVSLYDYMVQKDKEDARMKRMKPSMANPP